MNRRKFILTGLLGGVGIDLETLPKLPPAMLDRLQLTVLNDPGLWFERCSVIKDRRGELIRPKANAKQSRMFEVWRWCRDRGRPFRLVVRKDRQEGVSTASMALLFHYLARPGGVGLSGLSGGVYAREKSTSDNMVDMARLFQANDSLFPISPFRSPSRLWSGPVGPETGRSATHHFLVLSDPQMWDCGYPADQCLHGVLKTVPYQPKTGVVIELGSGGQKIDVPTVTFAEAKRGVAGFIEI